MQDTLTEEQIAFYQENGFLIIERFLDAEELAVWRQVTDEAVAERLGASTDYLTNQKKPDRFLRAGVYTVRAPGGYPQGDAGTDLRPAIGTDGR